MKRVAASTALAALSVLIFAGTAVAGGNGCGGEGYPPCPSDPTVLGKHTTHGSTAFTGANLSIGIATLAALMFVGLLALGLSRRRAASRG